MKRVFQFMVATVHRGSISVNAYPVRERHTSWKNNSSIEATSLDFQMTLMFPNLPELQDHIRRICYDNFSVNDNSIGRYLTPCVIDDPITEGKVYSARLLVPPAITKKSPLFVPGLVVPGLKVSEEIFCGNELKGYRMSTQHLPDQRFYVPPMKTLNDLSRRVATEFQEVEFQGIIMETHNKDDRDPRLYITVNSLFNPESFSRNSAQMKGFKGHHSFWWDVSSN